MDELQDQNASEHPIFNVGVVTRMTGVSIATLRAWERRYGFPRASRTAGGHRLYSERDVVRLRWVKAHIDQGMQTSRAIEALFYQESAERTSLDNPVLPAPPAGEGYTALSLRTRLTEALLRHHLDRADQILGEALPVLHPEGLIVDVIGPVMAAVGDAWHRGEINVATEHLATHYLRQRLLMWMISGPPPYAMKPIVLACAPGELHEGGLLMLGALLRRRRWPVAYLGQLVPLADLASITADLQPPLVVLAAMREDTAGSLTEWANWLPEAAQRGKPIMTFAGRIFTEQPEWRVRVPGVFLGATVADGVATIETLLREAGLP